MWNDKLIAKLFKLRDKDGLTWDEISEAFNNKVSANNCRKAYYRTMRKGTPDKSLPRKKKTDKLTLLFLTVR
jgi:hypothetical protein